MKWERALEICICKEDFKLSLGLKTEKGRVVSFSPLPDCIDVFLGKYKKTSQFYRDGIIEHIKEYGSEIEELKLIRDDEFLSIYGKIKDRFYYLSVNSKLLPFLILNCFWRKVPIEVYSNKFSLDLLSLNLDFLNKKSTSNVIEDKNFEYLEFERSEGRTEPNPLLPFLLSDEVINLEWATPKNDISLSLSIEIEKLTTQFYSSSLFSQIRKKMKNEEGKVLINSLEEIRKEITDKVYREAKKYGLKIADIKSSLDLMNKRKIKELVILNALLTETGYVKRISQSTIEGIISEDGKFLINNDIEFNLLKSIEMRKPIGVKTL